MKSAQQIAPESVERLHPAIHMIVYGYSGTQKSTLAASFPKPIYVVCFDGRGKAAPYRRAGDRIEMDESQRGTPIERVYAGKKMIIEIHHYQDWNIDKPDAFSRFRTEIRDFDDRAWGTFVFDSLTSAALSALMEQRFLINPGEMGAFDDRKSLRWNSGAVDQLEFQLARRFVGYECNVVVTAHVEERMVTIPTRDGLKNVDKRIEMGVEDEEGAVQIMRCLSAPGRLGKRGRLVSQYAETTRAYVLVDKKGRRSWHLQTEPDEQWVCCTQVPIPDGIAPDYEEFWK